MSNLQITVSPIDDSNYVSREQASSQQISHCSESAFTAQKQWREVSIAERAKICYKMIDLFVAQKEQIGKELTWMMGRPIRYAQGEVAGMQERALHMIDIAEQSLATVKLEDKPGFTRYIKRVPLGVVFVIAPWNFPYMTAINAIMPAIMAGNSVILKHSAQTPLCAERLYQAFDEAGLPKGVFQFLHLSHDATASLIQDPKIDHVCFTGSVDAGASVEKSAAGRFIGLGLELGGKDPAYIRADVDLDAAVETVIDGAFFNSGQSCCGIERIYVDATIHDQFIEKACALINQYQLGRPDDSNTTLGPMVKASAADFVREQIKQAVAQGATAHIDENNFPMSKPGSAYLAPQLLSNVDHNMMVMTQESFGPVVGVQKVDSDQQAIALMNDSEFGLTASIFTRDIETGIALGEQLETGTFFINRCDYLDPALAWTGVKNSGRGCTLSSMGYEQLTRPKSFHIKTEL
ncbi:MAG: aldehyde dehydrogenase family protein [Oceanospirillaceae bacterium]|nr:aldehyde dehydrogenase family protein [Oceanospirillaceae bacterium]